YLLIQASNRWAMQIKGKVLGPIHEKKKFFGLNPQFFLGTIENHQQVRERALVSEHVTAQHFFEACSPVVAKIYRQIQIRNKDSALGSIQTLFRGRVIVGEWLDFEADPALLTYIKGKAIYTGELYAEDR